MLPIVYATYLNYPYLNLPQLYQVPIDYAVQIPIKKTCDQACQFPEPCNYAVTIQEKIIDPPIIHDSKEILIEEELKLLLKYLSKNISLLKETSFNDFINENLKNLSFHFKEVPKMLKRRYIQINKTKEEMTKFIIRRCFQFIKISINYQDQENLGAEERDKLFYRTFFSDDKEFINSFGSDTIDDMIPFRKDSKLKTINDAYLKRLFESSRFCYFYKLFIGNQLTYIDQFKDICIQENDEKIENMAQQILKLIINREIQKIANYRRFPWKDHEFNRCEARAKEIYEKYNKPSIKIHSKVHLKTESSRLEFLSESIQ